MLTKTKRQSFPLTERNITVKNKLNYILHMHFKEVPSAHQACIYLIKNTGGKNCYFVKYYCNLK